MSFRRISLSKCNTKAGRALTPPRKWLRGNKVRSQIGEGIDIFTISNINVDETVSRKPSVCVLPEFVIYNSNADEYYTAFRLNHGGHIGILGEGCEYLDLMHMMAI
jgi:hypothetical protein